MSGLDKMCDARGIIQKYIAKQIRRLLESPMNDNQDPNWVQAALLFEQTIVPCEGYLMDSLYDLAQDIIKKAEQNNNRVIYQRIPELYNEKIVDVNSVDYNNLPDKVEIRDYEENIKIIKKWMEDFKPH